MWWYDKVVWSEGMLVRPQHFQQQDRYLQNLIQRRVAPIHPYPWGFIDLEPDYDLLDNGKFGLTACSGIFLDGTPFNIRPSGDPDNGSSPVVDVPTYIHNAIVYLAVPLLRPDAMEITLEERSDSPARFFPRKPKEVLNTTAVDRTGDYKNPSAPIEIAKMRLRLLIKEEQKGNSLSQQTNNATSAYSYLSVARIEKRNGNKVILDESFIPPCLDCGAAPNLVAYIHWLHEELDSLANIVAEKIGEAVRGGVSELHNFLLLQILNRCLPVIRHWDERQPRPHPLELYERSLELAGELATLVTSSRKVPTFPTYRHDDLAFTFRDVEKFIRDTLKGPISLATEMPIKPDKYGYYVADIADKTLLGKASLVIIAVRAHMPKKELDNMFPTSLTIGAPKEIHMIRRKRETRGVTVTATQVPPQIPFHANTCYFELDQHSDYWKTIVKTGGLALHIEGDFPGINMVLWAIQG
jgi:type VI secretion system protein ImpJ